MKRLMVKSGAAESFCPNPYLPCRKDCRDSIQGGGPCEGLLPNMYSLGLGSLFLSSSPSLLPWAHRTEYLWLLIIKKQHRHYQPFGALDSCQTPGDSWILLFCLHHLNMIFFCYCLPRMSIPWFGSLLLAQGRCSIHIHYWINASYLLS